MKCLLQGQFTFFLIDLNLETHLLRSGFDREDQWGHRAPEPNKAVICSLALAKLRTDIRGDLANNNAVGMAQKLLLFWRKPARRCWWEGIELENVEGVEGPLKIWIRRVWTLEMVSSQIFSPLCSRLMLSSERDRTAVVAFFSLRVSLYRYHHPPVFCLPVH